MVDDGPRMSKLQAHAVSHRVFRKHLFMRKGVKSTTGGCTSEW